MDVWASARYELGLSDEEFLSYPASMIFALHHRHVQQMQREELLLAMLHCSIINFSFSGPKEPATPDRFMLHPIKTEPPKPLTGEDLMAAFKHFPKSKKTT